MAHVYGTIPFAYNPEYIHPSHHGSMDFSPKDETAQYTFGSALLTIIIGALAFITALAWNDLARFAFEKMMKDDNQEIQSRLNYAILATSIAIIIGFLLMYYIEGKKW